MGLAYSFALLLVLGLSAPVWLVRMALRGHYRHGLAERLGLGLERLRQARAGRRTIWIHAVSVGEVLAAEALIHALRNALPAYVIAISTTTATGQRLARQRLPEAVVFYLPLDLAYAMRRVLQALSPDLLVLMESELWPRLLAECARSGVPVAVANARISDRSFPRYMRLRRLWRPLLRHVSLFLAQGEETAIRLAKIGAPADRIHAVGNLKYDAPAPIPTPLCRALQAALPQHLPVLVAGSTLAGEDDLILDAWQHLRRTGVACALVLAPRHVERWPAVAELLRTRAIPFVRASGWSISPSHMSQSASPVPVAQSGAARQTLQPGTVFLLDTIGDLASVYSLATIAFIGGSLVTGGGHNPLEPARFGVPVVQGPSFHNFREVVQAMQSRDAIRVVDSEHLAGTLRDLLCNAGVAHALGQRGQQVFLAQSGARDRSVAALLQLLGSAHAAPQATESLLQTELQ